MVLKVLTENTALSDELICEHGLSFYIETREHKILFDMGQSDALISNAASLGVDLSAVDIAFLSHGHYDHGGGLDAFLKVNSLAKVYINRNAFEDYYASDGRYLGLNKELANSERVILTGDELRVDDELYLFTGNKLVRKHYMDTFGLFVKRREQLFPDDFLHEQYLLISEGEKNILISGCSHKGILNIMDWSEEYDVVAVFGGFHYMKLSPQKDSEYLEKAAAALMKHNAKYYTCHCTGEEQYKYMKGIMGPQLDYISSGSIINL